MLQIHRSSHPGPVNMNNQSFHLQFPFPLTKKSIQTKIFKYLFWTHSVEKVGIPLLIQKKLIYLLKLVGNMNI